jgi:hypothetical protein
LSKEVVWLIYCVSNSSGHKLEHLLSVLKRGHLLRHLLHSTSTPTKLTASILSVVVKASLPCAHIEVLLLLLVHHVVLLIELHLVLLLVIHLLLIVEAHLLVLVEAHLLLAIKAHLLLLLLTTLEALPILKLVAHLAGH